MLVQIKNMVCPRCIDAVKVIFEKDNVPVNEVSLGCVDTKEHLSQMQLQSLKKALKASGFEILQSDEAKIIGAIKSAILELMSQDFFVLNESLSIFLSKRLKRDYSGISKTFSQVEGITIEHYLLQLKIEKAKELLTYGDLTISEIAYKLGYSHLAHLSSQFKKVTGMTPTQFKKLRNPVRKSLDEV